MDGGRIPNNPNPIGNNLQENRANVRNQQRFNRIANAVGQLAQAQLPTFAQYALMDIESKNPQDASVREQLAPMPMPMPMPRRAGLVRQDPIRPDINPEHRLALPTFANANPQDPF